MRLMFCAVLSLLPGVHADAIQPDCPPAFAGQLTRGHTIHRFGSIVALADLDGVTTFDMTDPAKPIQLGRVAYPIVPVVYGGASSDPSDDALPLLLVRLTSTRWCLVSVADPARPAIVADHLPLQCEGSVGGNVLVDACDGINETRIFDVRDTSNIVLSAVIPGVVDTCRITGDKLFLTLSTSTTVYDLSDPAAPRLLATLPFRCAQPTASGDLVLMLTDSLFRIVSFANPRSPVTLWSTTAGYYSHNGNDLYLSPWPTPRIPSVTHYDISDPASPTLLTTRIGSSGDIAFPEFTMNPAGPIETREFVQPYAVSARVAGPAYGMDIAGSLAVVAAGTSGLKVFDIADPSSPTLLGQVQTSGTAFEVAVQGSHAYVAARNGGLRIVDISDPRNPTLVGSNTTGNVIGLSVSGDRLVGMEPNAARLYDITDPRDPIAASSLVPDVRRASLLGRTMWGTGPGSSRTFDATDINNPAVLAQFEPSAGTSFLAREDYLFLYGGSLHFLRTAVNPTRVGVLPAEGDGGGSALLAPDAHDRIWYSTGSTAVCVDFSDPTSPYRCGLLPPTPVISGLCAEGDLIAACSGNSGFQIFRAPPAPASARLNGLRPASTSFAMANSADRLIFSGDRSMSIYVVDRTLVPKYASSFLLPGRPSAAAKLSSEHDFIIACRNVGLLVVSTDDPENPRIIGSIPMKEAVRSLMVENDVAVAVIEDRIILFDLEDPSEPSVLSSMPFEVTNIHTASLAGGLLVVERTSRDFTVYDLRDPLAPRTAGSLATTYWTTTPAFDGRWFYRSTERDLLAFDIADPDHPVLASTTAGGAQGSLFLHNGALYGASGVGRPNGGAIFDRTNPASPLVIGRWNVGFESLAFRDFVRNSSGLVTYYDGERASLVRFPGPVITNQPRSVSSCVGDTVSLVIATATPATYQWRRGGVPIPGATSSDLRVGPLRLADLAAFDCVVTDVGGCGVVISSPATVNGCRADVNCDGMVDCFDYMTFVEWYESGDPRCEVNGDDFTDFFDYDEFVTIFENGC